MPATEGGTSPRLGIDTQTDELSIAQLVKELQRLSVKHLLLPVDERSGWTDVCDFLECDPPVGAYPLIADRARRRFRYARRQGTARPREVEATKVR